MVRKWGEETILPPPLELGGNMSTGIFSKDVKISKESEKELIFLLESYGGIFLNDNDDWKYDLRFKDKKGKIVLFECKEDFKCAETNNVSLEYESYGKPSGINHTNAGWFIYKIHTKDRGIIFLLIKTSKLKTAITDTEDSEHKYFKNIQCTTEGKNRNYLFKLDVFIKLGELI